MPVQNVKLSKLSFEELQKLKERLGTNIYNEAMFGSKRKNLKTTQSEFKRENHNRPREMSSKKPVYSGIKCDTKVKKHMPRDPRFDSLCGTFNEKVCHSYLNLIFFFNYFREKIYNIHSWFLPTKWP